MSNQNDLKNPKRALKNGSNSSSSSNSSSAASSASASSTTTPQKTNPKSKQIPPNPFILVDGSSYLFRAYHALPPLTTAQGEPTGAMYGVLNMLRKIQADYKPAYLAVVFDSKEKNFRHTLYEPYKANRTVMPDDLQAQIQPLHTIIQAMGIPLVILPGYEADDIIATLAKKAKAEGLFTLISTGDKDFAQIVDDSTFLINTMSNDIYDRTRVIEKFEVPPELIIDFLTLMGDSVDNVPGVPKVGPKTAVKWLQTYQSLDAIIQHADEIPGKVGENLRATLPQLPLFKKLVTIDTNIPLEQKPEDFKPQKPNTEILKELFTRFEFKTWLRDLQISETPAPKKVNYEIILTEPHLQKWIDRLQKSKLFSLSIQTDHADYMTARILGISFAIEEGEAAYLPLCHDYLGCPSQIPKDKALKLLKPLLEKEAPQKVGHNVKFLTSVFQNYSIHLAGCVYDTIIESYVLNSAGTRHEITVLASKYLDYLATNYEEVVGKGAKQIVFDKILIETAAAYAAELADVILRLHHHLYPKITEELKLKYILDKIEIPLIPVLRRMERMGVLIDRHALENQGEELEIRLKQLEEKAFEIADMPFNLNSPKQLQEVLYTHLKLPILEKTPTGQPSTAESVLEDLAEKYPLPKIILEYRSLSKLKSTYIDALPKQIDLHTGRIHTSYQQTVTSTGRLSSINPNLQNIPIRTDEGRKIRKAFIADPGYKIVSVDYSQIELRIMAHFSQDKNLIHAFSIDDDIHRSTAAEFFGVPLTEVNSDQRRQAKIINFGLLYGMSGFGLSKQLGVGRDQADDYMKRYFECFPSVRAFIESIKREATLYGFVETLFGRRLYLPDIQSRNMTIRKAQERAAINAPMQGTNADIIKLAMIRIDEWIQKNNMNLKMLMQVHDELVFEIGEECLNPAIAEIKKIMENVVDLSVPLKVGIGIGDNWDEAH